MSDRRGMRPSPMVAGVPSAATGRGATVERETTRFCMHEQVPARADDYVVETDSGQRAFWIQETVPGLKDTLILRDMWGIEIYRIDMKIARPGDLVSIYHWGDKVAVVKRSRFAPGADRYWVKVRGKADLWARGSVAGHDYQIDREGVHVATISRDWFPRHDSYGVEIEAGEDAALILAVTICIDAMSATSQAA